MCAGLRAETVCFMFTSFTLASSHLYKSVAAEEKITSQIVFPGKQSLRQKLCINGESAIPGQGE